MSFQRNELPICICNDVSEEKIKSVIKRGARSIEAVNMACGAGMSCGSCHFDIERMIAEQTVQIRIPARKK
jgi:assimilatory nitrate reductase catalytic subunit